MNRQESPPSKTKLYVVQNNDCCNFCAGVSAQGNQVLMGVAPDRVVAVFFERSGRHLRHEDRRVRFEPAAGLSPAQQDQERIAALWRAIDAWKTEIGFVLGEVKVTQFSVPCEDDWDIGIADLPQFLEEFLDAPSSWPDEGEHKDLLEDIEFFRRNGKYVLRWGTEYWMSREGEVTDT